MPAGGQAMAQALGGAASNIASLPQQAFEASEGLRQTGQYDPAPATQTAMALMGAGAPFAEPGAAGIFGGQLAKGADIEKMLDARLMARAGSSPTNTLRATGWHQGADGQWRFEISDQGATWSNPASLEGNFKLGDVLNHPELYKYYPQLKDYKVIFDESLAPGNASFNAGLKRFRFPTQPDAEDIGSAIHEAQHAIQHIEGFTQGSMPNIRNYGDYLAQALTKHPEVDPRNLDPGRVQRIFNSLYTRTAGEVEARNADARRNFLASTRRMISPWETEDVPRSLQINAP